MIFPRGFIGKRVVFRWKSEVLWFFARTRNTCPWKSNVFSFKPVVLLIVTEVIFRRTSQLSSEKKPFYFSRVSTKNNGLILYLKAHSCRIKILRVFDWGVTLPLWKFPIATGLLVPVRLDHVQQVRLLVLLGYLGKHWRRGGH